LLAGLRQENDESLDLSRVLTKAIADVARVRNRGTAGALRFQALLFDLVVGNEREDAALVGKVLSEFESLPCPYRIVGEPAFLLGGTMCRIAAAVARISYGRLKQDKAMILTGVARYDQARHEAGDLSGFPRDMVFLLEAGYARALLERAVVLNHEANKDSALAIIKDLHGDRIHTMQAEINSQLMRMFSEYQSNMK